MSLRGFGIFIACIAMSACGSSSTSTAAQSGLGNGGDTQPQGQNDQANAQAQEGAMGLANSLHAELERLKSEHEAAWQERIRTASGRDLDEVGMRFVGVNADFTARAEQAWQTMNAAVMHLRQNQLDHFRRYINESRSHVAVLRQMVEQIQGELARHQSTAVEGTGAPPPQTAPQGADQPPAAAE